MLPRLSIARLMAVVAAVAVNIAIARAFLAYNAEMLVGTALTGLALQGASICLARGRGRVRAFWTGFTMFGSVTMASFIWAMSYPEVLGITRTGTLVKRPGSPLYDAWMGYGRLVFDLIGPLLSDPRIDLDPDSPALVVARALVWSLPQWFVALVGGLGVRGLRGAVEASGGAISHGGTSSEPALQRTRPAAQLPITSGATEACRPAGLDR